jgi:hypothetical protein
MGADLYINSIIESNEAQWKPSLEQAEALRDSLQPSTPEYDQACQQVSDCYHKIHERGYFRDSYGNALLWWFGLSWWTDVIPLLDEDSYLSVHATQTFLARLKEREVIFAANLMPLPAKEQTYYRTRYAELHGFLQQALDLNEPIYCSL